MHDTYKVIPILEKFPLHIEAIAAYDENLLIGTRQGHLLMHNVSITISGKCDVSLLRSNKNFSRRPINQIAVVPEHQILISLSDNLISVHDLTVYNFPLLVAIEQTKGATTFDLDIKHYTSLTGEGVVAVRLVVAVKRKLQLYYWKGRQFQQLRDDLALPDTPRIVMWCGEAIAVGFKGDYWLVMLTGEQKELFPTGRNQEPLIAHIGESQLAFSRDEKTVFVDCEGNASCNYFLVWKESPLAIVYDKPYIIAVHPKNVEIKTCELKDTVQNVDLEKFNLITSSLSRKNRSHIYIASSSHVCCLSQIPINHQIPQLIQEKQFQLALNLASIWEETDDAKEKMTQHIQCLHAFYLFTHSNFEEAMTLFYQLETDLLFVIGLFPGFVPEEYRSKLQYPGPVPELKGVTYDEAVLALIVYLLQLRQQLNKHGVSNTESGRKRSRENFGHIVKSRLQKLQIIDTTLLKCYLETNDALVEHLLRMPDSKVSVEEGERLLRKANKYSELVLLFQTRGYHQKALLLLLRHAKKENSPIKGHLRTVSYLQHLGPSYIDLIFEYGSWVLKESPADGLEIFIGDESCPDVKMLPRPKVLNFLKKTEKSLLIPYLEHAIHEWDDDSSVLHNELIHQYRDRVLKSMSLLDSGMDDSNFQHNRNLLLNFLRTSKYCTAATVLVHFPHDCLHEERAIILGKLGQHKQALELYVNMLNDTSQALEYCNKHYFPVNSGSDVYLILLKIILSKFVLENKSLNNNLAFSSKYRDKSLEFIISLLNEYASKINISDVVKVMPDSVPTCLLHSFFKKSLNSVIDNQKQKRIGRGLAHSVKLQMAEETASCFSDKIHLSEGSFCCFCSKRFTKYSAFARKPNGDIVHFSCKDFT